MYNIVIIDTHPLIFVPCIVVVVVVVLVVVVVVVDLDHSSCEAKAGRRNFCPVPAGNTPVLIHRKPGLCLFSQQALLVQRLVSPHSAHNRSRLEAVSLVFSLN